MDYDEFANMQQAIDIIIRHAVKVWHQTDDLNFAIETTAQRFGVEARRVRLLTLDRLMEYDGVEA